MVMLRTFVPILSIGAWSTSSRGWADADGWCLTLRWFGLVLEIAIASEDPRR